MNTIQINIPEGFEIESLDKNTGEVKFKEITKKTTDHIKTVDDVLEDNNLTQEELDKMFINVPEHFKYQHIAELLAKSLNDGWQPDWDNDDQYKYFPWFVMSSSGFRFYGYDDWCTVSLVGSRFCFKNRELATYAGKQFTEVYKQFMINN